MGTRRPLVVCMVHDPTAQEPRCKLQDEDSDEFGPVIPENSVSEAIRERTETHLRRIGATVSSKPIVMRAEYAYCPNLTLIDTPGFILKARKGEAESTPDDIMRMVKEQCAPTNRLILFLQQSSVEWCSSLWMHVIQEVDPQFQRTVMVASKFDNRMKELTERWEVDKYLSASGYLPPNVKPFFVALPKDRSASTSVEWRKAIQEVDSSIKAHLRGSITGGFDEERFGSKIGFGNLRRYLEEELAARYRDAAPSTLALLQDRCTAVAAQLATAEQRLQKAGDVAALRRASIEHVLSLTSMVDAVLYGSPATDPSRYGLTTDGEREMAGVGQWPGVSADIRPPNSNLKLFGGAAFERCLLEFQAAAAAATFPPVPRDRVANMLLAYKSRGSSVGAAAKAAEELARGAAKDALGPLLDATCARLCRIIVRAFDIAAEQAQGKQDASAETLRAYVAFHTAVRSAFQKFSQSLEDRGKELMRHHLEAATGEFAVAALQAGAQLEGGITGLHLDDGDHDEEENEIPPSTVAVQRSRRNEEDGLAGERPPFNATQMTVPETPSPDVLTAKKAEVPLNRQVRLLQAAGRNIDAASPGKGRVAKAARLAGIVDAGVSNKGGYVDVCARAERLFAMIKDSVVGQTAPATLKAAFLEPVHSKLATELSVQIVGRTDKEFMDLFAAASAVQALEEEAGSLRKRVEGLTRMKQEFGEIARAI